MSEASYDGESRRIANAMLRLWSGPCWHGPALKDVLEGVTAEAAASRRAPEVHSIWELLLHIATWARVARLTLDGQPYPTDLPDEENFPKPSGSWEDAKAAVEQELNLLAGATRALPDESLGKTVTGETEYSYYLLLHGVVEHTIYHAGQIAILKKM